jgi:inhibitor of cysteine peptidase
MDDEYVQDTAEEGTVGVGGNHIWVFKVTDNSSQSISAIYKPAWEESTGDEDIFTLTIDVVPDTTTPVYTIEDTTETVKATKGDTIAVKLPENPTTGYTWNLSASSGLSLMDDEYVQDTAEEGTVGVGGNHIWVFKVTDDVSQNISAIYKPAWEESTGDEEIFTLTIEAMPKTS